MKKPIACALVCLFALLGLCGCNKSDSLLNPKKPVTLTMWHVYGEQSDSPMDRYITEFNQTVGKEKGIIVNVTLLSNASQIGQKLLNAQKGKAGLPSMPDLFFCHTSNAVELGVNNLIDWNEKFSKSELNGFVDSFVTDGTAEGKLSVLPVSKSTHLLFLAGSSFERFSKATGVTESDLATWDGFFMAAEKYYEYSGGKPFCALDYLLRAVELDAISRGATDFYNDNGWYKNDEKIIASFSKFATAIAKGHIIVADLYSNTQVMTGQTISGISSSAAVLYYNDVITYKDNSTEETNLKVLPLPQNASGEKYVTQAGVGLVGYKTTRQKAEAQTVFAKWFTEEKRNLDFVAETGYMPVKDGAFDKLASHEFKKEKYKATQDALRKTKMVSTFLSEPTLDNYYPNTYAFYGQIRTLQKQLAVKYAGGESVESITAELLKIFYNIGN